MTYLPVWCLHCEWKNREVFTQSVSGWFFSNRVRMFYRNKELVEALQGSRHV